MKKWYKICGFVCFFLTTGLAVRSQTVVFQKFTPKNTFRFSPKQKIIFVSGSRQNPVKQKDFTFFKPEPVPQNAGMLHYGIFCKAELKTDAFLKMPVRFRLGSLSYCDYMEGKSRIKL